MSSDEKKLDGSGVDIDDESLVSSDTAGGVDSTVTLKDRERRKIQSEIEEFLSRGGQITHVDSTVMSDPPKRPATNYGGQPI